MLGLAALSLVLLHKGRDLLAASVFVLAMCYKQMAIYYAPALCVRMEVGQADETASPTCSASASISVSVTA